VTVSELDRLMSKTDLTPLSKVALRHVRKAITRGESGEARILRSEWSVSISGEKGHPVTMRFAYRRQGTE
jgi:hypothetical protein